MKTRLLRPEENWKSNLTMAVAFEGDYDLEKAKESAARERTEEEKREDARNRCFGTFLDDDETICGVVNSREYLCRFDGGTYKLGGVGGVSTLPQYRRGGVIRACMTTPSKTCTQTISRSLFCIRSVCSITASSALKPVRRNTAGRCRSQR